MIKHASVFVVGLLAFVGILAACKFITECAYEAGYFTTTVKITEQRTGKLESELRKVEKRLEELERAERVRESMRDRFGTKP